MEISGPPLNVSTKPLVHSVFDSMKNNPDLLCCIDGSTGKKFTYKELLKKSIQVAISINRLGIGKKDVVCMAMELSFDSLTVSVGTWLSGATSNPINPKLTQEEIKVLFQTVKPKLIFCGSFYEKIKEARDEICPKTLILRSQNDSEIKEWITQDISTFTLPEVDSESHQLYILFTSGTTGFPKGIQISDRAFQIQTKFNEMAKAKYMVLATSPPFWVSGPLIMTQTFNDAKTILIPSLPVKEREIIELIGTYQPDTFFVAPSLLLRMAEAVKPSDDFSSLKQITTAGSRITSTQKKVLNSKLFNNSAVIRSTYGSTEAGCITVWSDDIDTNSTEYETVGTLAPNTTLKVVDSVGKTLGPKEHGGICVKTSTMLLGVMSLEGESSGLDEEGWLHTGDLGYWDKKNLIYIVGRLKEIMKYRSLQIAPAEIENILYTHPDVAECYVVGKPDPVDGELPSAFVIKRPNSIITEEELEKFVADRVIDEKKLRGGVHFVKEIAKSAAGKPLPKPFHFYSADNNK